MMSEDDLSRKPSYSCKSQSEQINDASDVVVMYGRAQRLLNKSLFHRFSSVSNQ